jgi:lipopolysaccharide export system permease protein
MRLLDRYVLREFLVPLGYCLCGFLIFWIAFDLFSELHAMQDKQLLARDIAEYYLFRVPEFLPMALPVALLLALLYSMTNHVRYNELTAMRAAGLSLWRVSAPYLALGLMTSAALFVLNEFCAPQTEEIAEEILTRRMEGHLSTQERGQIRNPPLIVNSREGRFWKIGIYNETTGEMIKPRVDWHLPDGSWRSIEADRAVRQGGVWTFSGTVKQNIQSNSLPLKLPPVPTLAMPEFSETPDEIKSQISVSDRFGRQTRTRRADVPIAEILNCLRLYPNPEPALKSWLATKLQGRFAGPCACLVVVLIGVPFAAASGRRSVFVGVAASITIFFVYFILQQVGFALGEAGRLSPWIAAWLPNLTFGTAGLWMMIRVR